jgi:hypothetical protein
MSEPKTVSNRMGSAFSGAAPIRIRQWEKKLLIESGLATPAREGDERTETEIEWESDEEEEAFLAPEEEETDKVDVQQRPSATRGREKPEPISRVSGKKQRWRINLDALPHLDGGYSLRGLRLKTGELTDDIVRDSKRPDRILILVHGTGANTEESFAALLGDAGVSFRQVVAKMYKACLVFDHKTLSETPTENARRLWKLLKENGTALKLGQETRIDLLTTSRGALVARAFAEEVLPEAEAHQKGDQWPDVGRIVMVGAAPGGTRLVEDIRNNIDKLSKILEILGVDPEKTPPRLRLLFKLVGLLGQPLLDPETGALRGIAALDPKGPYLTKLNKGSKESPARFDKVTMVLSVFDADAQPLGEREKAEAKYCKAAMVSSLALDHAGSDLVVDEGSLERVHRAYADRFVPEVLAKNCSVHHLNYFEFPEVYERILIGLNAKP